MKKYVFVSVLVGALFFCVDAGFSASHYVRPTGGSYGSENGSDWNNAFDGLPSKLVRGDTYYVAGGVYKQSWTLDDPENGTSVITIKKANAKDCSNVAGWNSSFESDQAVVYNSSDKVYGSAVVVKRGYYKIDGVTGSDNKGHGIKLRYANLSQRNDIVLFRDNPVSNFLIRHVEFAQAGKSYNYSQFAMLAISGRVTNLKVQHCYAHDFGVFYKDSGGGGTVIEHSYFKDNWSSSRNHGELLSIVGADGLVFRYNTVNNATNGTGGIIALGTYSRYGNVENVQIYGNLFYADSPSVGNGLWGTGNSTDPCGLINWKIYNNTVVNMRARLYTGNPGVRRSSGIQIKNNLFYGSMVEPYADHNEYEAVHNYYNNIKDTPPAEGNDIISSESTSNLFANYSGKDFYIKSGSGATNKGTNLSTFFKFDILGNTFGGDGSWDIGAYESSAGNGGSEPTEPIPPMVTGLKIVSN